MGAYMWVLATWECATLCSGLVLTFGLGQDKPVRALLTRGGIFLLGLAILVYGVLAPDKPNWGGFALPMLIPPLIAAATWAVIHRFEKRRF